LNASEAVTGRNAKPSMHHLIFLQEITNQLLHNRNIQQNQTYPLFAAVYGNTLATNGLSSARFGDTRQRFGAIGWLTD
jgi:hypothetical protein